MDSIPDSDEEYYYLKFITNYHESHNINKNKVVYSLLPKKISEIAGGSLSSIQRRSGYEPIAELSFIIVPDELWIEKNVILLDEYWDSENHVYYSMFRVSKILIDEFHEYVQIYRPISILDSFSRNLYSNLERIAWDLAPSIPNGSKIAVTNIEMWDSNLSNTAYDIILTQLLEFMQYDKNRNYTIFERRSVDVIKTEHQFQFSGEVDDDTLISIGKFIGADVIITGGIDGIGQLRRFRIKAIDVKTARIIIQLSYKID
jgi:hypothetical protein